MDTLFQTEKQAKPVKPVSLSRPQKTRLGSDAVGSFQARCASALRLALPLELKAHGAANRCGFSRPFVAALLDSGTYTGKVHRTAGGHRKVLASEFEALVAGIVAYVLEANGTRLDVVTEIEPSATVHFEFEKT